MNEYIFLIHAALICLITLGSLWLGKHALAITIVLYTLMANLFVTKQIILFHLHITPTDAFAIGAVTALNLMQEYYGAAAARTALLTSFAANIVFNIMAQIHLFYIPSPYDATQHHFEIILNHSARIVAASLTAYLLSQWAEYQLYERLKILLGKNNLIVRAWTATIFAQLIDTVFFSFFGLYGIVQSVADIMVISYAIKIVTLLTTMPTLWLSTYFVSKKHVAEPL